MVIYLRHLRKPALAVVILVLLSVGTLSLWSKVWNNGEGGSAIGEERAKEAFLAAVSCFGRVEDEIEIFDIEKGEVIRKIKMSEGDKSGIKVILENISGMVVKVKAFPEKGHIARIPLKPALNVENKWLSEYGVQLVGEAFIIFPEGKDPYLLLLDSEYRPLFFEFRKANDGRNFLEHLKKSFTALKDSD